MTIETTKLVLRRFLKEKKPGVLALKGSWGVGKTYLLRQIVNQLGATMSPARYSYVSLFGVGSIADLRIAIYAKSRDMTKPEQEKAGTHGMRRLLENWNNPKAWIAGKENIKDAPYGKLISAALDVFAQYNIDDTVVCLDDFERLDPSAIKPDELLGFVSSLKEERGCKILLIFNESALGASAESYQKYREKVIDCELLFAPSTQEAIDIAFPPALPFRDSAQRCAKLLDIRNIRILRKITQVIELGSAQLAKFHSAVVEQFVSTAVLFTWIYYEQDSEKPPFAFVKTFNTFVWHVDNEKKEGEKPQEYAWVKKLEEYGFAHADELDLAISRVVERGYVEETGLLEEAAKLDETYHAKDVEGEFDAAWALFHESFKPDEAPQLVEALRSGLTKSALYVSPLNLNGTIVLLRQLGHDKVADELIETYVNARKGQAKLFDLDNYPFSGDITDKRLKAKFSAQVHAALPILTLRQAVEWIALGEGWNPEHLAVLEKATAADLYALFNEPHGKNLGRVVKACLRFDANSGHSQIGQNARAALQKVAQESDLNEIRVKRYGVSIAPKEAVPAGQQPK